MQGYKGMSHIISVVAVKISCQPTDGQDRTTNMHVSHRELLFFAFVGDGGICPELRR